MGLSFYSPGVLLSEVLVVLGLLGERLAWKLAMDRDIFDAMADAAVPRT